MPCYFGGSSITGAKDLFEPNSLINAYFLRDHYISFLEHNFNIISIKKYEEKYTGKELSTGEHYNFVLKKRHQTYNSDPINDNQFKSRYDAVLNHLMENK